MIGVMPSGFLLPVDYGALGATQAWLPLRADAASDAAFPGPGFPAGGGSHGFFAVARLRPGVTAAAAGQELRAWSRRMTAEDLYPKNWNYVATAVPMSDQARGGIRQVLWVLFGAVSLVLLIACANLAGLFLVRGERRRREFAVRSALGAGRGRLLRGFVAEAAIVAVAGGCLGVYLASILVSAVPHFAPTSLPRIAEARIDTSVLAYTLGASLLSVLLFGLLPALRSTRVAPGEALNEGGRGGTSGAARMGIRRGLVAAQAAIAVLLTVGAGLMVESVSRLLAIDPGLRPDHVLTMQLSAPSAMYGSSADVVRFFGAVREEVGTVPAVRAVGAARLLPLASEMGDWGIAVEGYTPPPEESTTAEWQVVTAGYFEAAGLRLAEGRLLDERDGMEAPLAMVISERLAEKYFAGRDPLGSHIRIGGRDAPGYTVVGVVGDVRHNALDAEVKPTFYATQAQFAVSPGFAPRTMSLMVRTAGDPRLAAGQILRAIRGVDPRLPVSEVRTMQQVVEASIASPRFGRLLLGAFAALALLLTIVGTYGVVAQVVAMRRREIGIRMAVGASPTRVVLHAMRSGLQPAAFGVAVGILLALALARVLAGLVYGVATRDPLTIALAAATALAIATLASLVPASRAALVDPASSLREE